MTHPPRPQHHRRTSDVIKRDRPIDYASEALPASIGAAQMDLPQNPANGVEVRNVTKRFRISTQSMGRMSSFLFHRLISGARREDFYAVKDVSFDIRRGEMLGILGVNGSGKSTLLKMITGITTPTSGDIRRLPRIAPLLDLGAGFHPALSGYENIFLNGSIIGLHRDEIRELLPKIIEFSGLDHKFLEAPVRTYSAGMMARLGFAVAVSVDPDIILIDEVLAVGDLEFQAKSAQRLLEFREQGKAMALVSHTSAAIGELSTEAIWLHQGEMRLAGDAVDVVSAYNAHLTDQVRRAGRKLQDERMHEQTAQRPHTVFFERCELHNEKGLPTNEFASRGHLTISFDVVAGAADQPLNRADILVTLQYQTGVIVEEFFASDRGFHPLKPGAGRCRVEITFDPLLLLPGDYVLELSAVDVTDSEAILGISPEMAFEVTGPLTSFGVYPALVPVEFRTA